MSDDLLVFDASFVQLIKIIERSYLSELELLGSEFAIVRYDAIKRLKGYVSRIELVQNPYGVNVVVEILSSMLVIALRQEALSGMPERRMSYVMAKGYRLDQIGVKAKEPSNAPRNACNQLNMESSSRDVIVIYE